MGQRELSSMMEVLTGHSAFMELDAQNWVYEQGVWRKPRNWNTSYANAFARARTTHFQESTL